MLQLTIRHSIELEALIVTWKHAVFAKDEIMEVFTNLLLSDVYRGNSAKRCIHHASESA